LFFIFVTIKFMHVLHIINEYDCKKLCIIMLLMLFYIIMALNCMGSTIKCNIVFMLQLGLLWKMSMSHMTSLQL
jgi:hypothetical protein